MTLSLRNMIYVAAGMLHCCLLSSQDKRAAIDTLLLHAQSIYSFMPDSSMSYCEEAEKLSKEMGFDEQQAFSLTCEARYLLLKGDLKPSLEKLNEAVGIFSKLNNTRGLAKCYSLKSILEERMGNKKEHLGFLLKARDLYIGMRDSAGIAATSVNLSNLYNRQGKYDSALAILDALEEMRLDQGSNSFFTELNRGLARYGQGEFEKASAHFSNAVNNAQKFKMVDSEITGLTYLAQSFFKLKKNNEAISILNEAIALSRTNDLIVEEADALEKLIDVYEQNRNFQEAFLAFKRFRLLKDSLMNIEKMKSLNEIGHRLNLAEKEKIIAEQSLALEKENAELASSKLRSIMLSGGLLILFVAVAFLFVYLGRTRSLYAQIQVQKKEVEYQKELLEVKNKEVTDSINYARYIQHGMLPSEKTVAGLFPSNFILYKAKDIVAGDFYWVEKTSDGRALLAVCDCTGHGVPGAMVSIVASNALTRAVKEFRLNSPSLIFDKVNHLMQEAFSKNDYDIKDGMDGVLCAFDPDSLRLDVVAANNPLWIVRPAVDSMGNKQAIELSQVNPDKQPLGKYGEEIRPFGLKTVQLRKGEMIYLFSDGYADQFGGPKGKKFKYKQLEELLISIAHLPMDGQKQALEERFDAWRGRLDQVDDVLIVGIRI